MYLVAIGWMYVVLMMTVAEALSPQGTVLGALFTFVLYGCLPLAVVLYLLCTPARRRASGRIRSVSPRPVPDPSAPQSESERMAQADADSQ